MPTNPTILIVDDEPKHLKLMKVFIPSVVDGVEIDVADNPEDATKIIEQRKAPYPIIWSDYKFHNSKMDGLAFLQAVSKISPFSSRLLCSASFPEYDMIELVKSGAIHIYACKPLITKPLKSSIQIGIEYHKVNVMGEFVDVTDYKSTDHLETILGTLGDVDSLIQGQCQLDTENNKEELNQLMAFLDVTLKKFQISIAMHWALREELKEKKGQEENLKKCDDLKYTILKMEGYLTRSKIIIKNNLNHISKTRILTSEMDKKFLKLKDEFKGE